MWMSERITIEATGANTQLGVSGDFYIESIRHTIDRNKIHWCTWECSPIPTAAGIGGDIFWALDVSQLGYTTALHY